MHRRQRRQDAGGPLGIEHDGEQGLFEGGERLQHHLTTGVSLHVSANSWAPAG